MNRFQWKWIFTGSRTCYTIWRPFWFAMVAILNHKWLPKYKNPLIWSKLFLAMFYILFWGVYLYMFSCFLYPVTELVVIEFGSQLSFLKLLWNLHKSTTETCKKYSVTNFLLYISYKTTFFQNIIPKSILVRFWWNFTNKRENVCSFQGWF
jgi:hypothetical protein